MAPRRRAKPEIIPDPSLTIIHQVACLQMNISDACHFLSHYYYDEVALDHFGARIKDQALMKWYEATTTLQYIVGRGNRVRLPDFQRPEIDYQNHMDSLMGVLNLQKELTKTLQILFHTAFNIGDIPTLNFVRGLIPQQSKNEESLQQEIDGLRKRIEQAREEEEEK